MSSEHGPVASDALLEASLRVLRQAEIPPFGDGAFHWLVPPELIEEFLPPPQELRLWGYPVHMEAFIGETTIILMQTVGSARVAEAVA